MTRELRNRRRAFSLIELLVVIAIIGILAGLASWAVVAMISGQQRNNTQNTIKVVNKVLQSHWQFVVAEAKKDADDGLISPAVTNLAAPDPTGERARVLWVKFRLMEAFPQSYADVTSPFVYSNDPNGNPYIPISSKRRYIGAYQKSFATPPYVQASNQPGTQSAACLLMALGISRGGSVLTPDQIGYAVGDTDNDGVKELVDGWNKPLVFVRFDAGALVQAANPAAAGSKNATFADPEDPDGMLLTNAWYNSLTVYLAPKNARVFFESVPSGYSIASVAPTATTTGTANYVIPSITSAGKDGILGTQDDIISYQLR